MICHNYTLRRIAAVDLDDIVDIKLAAHVNLRNDEAEILQKLDKTNPWELILEEKPQVVYCGEVTFMFKNKYLKELLKRFGNPGGEIKQDTQYLTEYTVAVILFRRNISVLFGNLIAKSLGTVPNSFQFLILQRRIALGRSF